MHYVPTYRSTLSRHPPSCVSPFPASATTETISSLQVVRGDAWELESAQDREIGRAQKTERLPPRTRARRTRGHRTRKRVRVITEEWSLWIHPASIVPTRVQVYAPRSTSCSSHRGWMRVEGILNVVDRDDSGPVTQLDGGGQPECCARPTVTYRTSMSGVEWRLAGQGAAALRVSLSGVQIRVGETHEKLGNADDHFTCKTTHDLGLE
ncbi:hypothetical protein B0H14DRAFT_2564370 [Mycena olivaceomarginata]|nr:hypothetical protein B0H14DRAFT_2564370 [Mycena olivaceomarginata]